jgi:hypothetical protein
VTLGGKEKKSGMMEVYPLWVKILSAKRLGKESWWYPMVSKKYENLERVIVPSQDTRKAKYARNMLGGQAI